MALGTIVRQGVALAKSITGTGGLLARVSHEAWIGQTVDGDSEYEDPVFYDALVEQKPSIRHLPGGKVIPIKGYVAFLEPVPPHGAEGRQEPIDPRDRITFPDGQTGPIVDIAGFIDPSITYPYLSEVWIGVGAV